jgi:hypothetical protein
VPGGGAFLPAAAVRGSDAAVPGGAHRHFLQLAPPLRLERLRPFFSGDIAERIDDTTPLWVPGGPANRFEEIMAFVRSRGLDEAGWLALDDSAFEFPRSCANLVLCDGRFGLTEDVAMRLAGRLALMSGEP